jgi:cell division protein FtsZ
VMLVGETQDKNKTEEVVKDAMNHPLLDVDYRGASGGLVHITGGPDLTLDEAEGIASSITDRLEANANVIWGARIQEEYKGKVRVMAIMTGVQSAQILGPTAQKQADKSKQAMNTGDGEIADPADAEAFDASENVDTREGDAWGDGGQNETDNNGGLDVIRTN